MAMNQLIRTKMIDRFHLTISLNKLYEIFILIYSFIFVFTPMGSFPTLRTILFFTLILFYMIVFYRNFTVRIPIYISLIFLFFLTYTLYSFFIGFYEPEVLLELKSFLGLYISGFILVYSFKIISLKRFIKTIIISHIFYIIVKIFILIGLLYNYSFAYKIINIISDSLIEQILAYSIPRINFANDLISPILILIIILLNFLRIKFFKDLASITILFLLIINIFITFNRFNLLMLIVGSVILFILYPKKNLKYILILLSMVIFIILILFTSDLISNDSILYNHIKLWQIRIETEGSISNEEKFYQYILFIDRIETSVLIGNGMGSFLYDYIRDSEIRYGYEAFFLVLVYQFGIIGMIFLLISYYSIFLVYIKYLRYKSVFFILILYTFLLLSSFINPMILNSTYSIIYSFLASIFYYLKKGVIKNER